MTIPLPPKKPFENFKWRWAVLTPTESLNDPSVFLGVLRVYNKYDGFHPGAKEVLHDLSIVQKETNCPVDLVRTSDRNLIRNSGQYWKLFGLLDDSHGRISVSNFGKMLSDGDITKIEFATTIIKTFELPNRNIISDTTEWDRIGLKIRPLQLILDILNLLDIDYGSEQAYITSDELIKIVIPLSGAFARLDDYCEVIILSREGKINIDSFPDCAPESNDKRMVREYLLFLRNYGYIREDQSDRHKYLLLNITKEEIEELDKIVIESELPEKVAKQLQLTQIPGNIERKKLFRELLERPYQSTFRKNILYAYNMKCLITGVDVDDVLEAAHIIPISNNGNDQIENGLCLRSDIHNLYDAGHLRIHPDGDISISDIANTPNNYNLLPKHIEIPEFVSKDFLNWRIKYY